MLYSAQAQPVSQRLGSPPRVLSGCLWLPGVQMKCVMPICFSLTVWWRSVRCIHTAGGGLDLGVLGVVMLLPLSEHQGAGRGITCTIWKWHIWAWGWQASGVTRQPVISLRLLSCEAWVSLQWKLSVLCGQFGCARACGQNESSWFGASLMWLSSFFLSFIYEYISLWV